MASATAVSRIAQRRPARKFFISLLLRLRKRIFADPSSPRPPVLRRDAAAGQQRLGVLVREAGETLDQGGLFRAADLAVQLLEQGNRELRDGRQLETGGQLA